MTIRYRLAHHWARARVAVVAILLSAVTALAGCGGSGATATPTPTNTASATPGIPTLRYHIVAQSGNTTLQAIPAVALPVSSGTNFHWTPANDFQRLTCVAKGTADPGGPAGHTLYQVFLCQLATGRSSGSGSFIFTQVGSTTPEKLAQVAIDNSGPQGQDAPILSFTITTSQFDGAASLALTVSSGTPYEWAPASGAQGLTFQSGGNATPGGPPGSPYYHVFTCQLAAGVTSGHGALLFAASGMNTPAPPQSTVQVKLALPG